MHILHLRVFHRTFLLFRRGRIGIYLSLIHISKNFSPLTLKIKKFISDNLGKEITLEDIGNETFFSPAHCASVFRRETGKSIIDYAIDEKLKAAKKLIIEGLPLKCAETVGFDDYSYFSRLFKKRVSLTPLQYKKFSQS